ncbi:MAG: molybdenum ABC transporter ATP-binding protein [Ramlibacter sp.]|nr:molybdenum ABC transporter ATP-binding protein [Ramlibacter sp.]
MSAAGPRVTAQLRLARPGFVLDVALDLPGRGVSALLGPSGCGKTTTLRALAGLEHAAGHLQVQGETWQDDARGLFMPTHRRALGFVFQDSPLFAHLTVRGNVEFGMRRAAPAQRQVSLSQAVELLGIGPLMDRRPDGLSGGERQRVAMARALATRPRLLLMDEPLAALDAQRKAEVLPWLERLHRELDIPVVYVSHAVEEVARLADHLVLMEAGRVLASGPAQDLLARGDLPLARTEAAGALIAGTVLGHDPAWQLTSVAFAGGQLQLAGAPPHPVGRPVRLRVQARDVSLCLTPPPDSSILNILPVCVTHLHDDGAGQVMVALDAGGTPLLARITGKSAALLGLRPGMPAYAQVKGIALVD